MITNEQTKTTRSEIPVAPGAPIVGNLAGLTTDIAGFLVEQHKALGPVFWVRVFNRHFIVLAGTEANRLFSQEGKHLLRSADFWRDNDAALGAKRSLISMDGEDHTRMRKVQRPGYARSTFTNQLDTALSIATREMKRWSLNQPLPTLYHLRRIITEQLSVVTAGHSAVEDIDDIIRAVKIMLATQVTGQRPKILMHTPGNRRARMRFLEIGQEVLAAHTEAERRNKAPDLISSAIPQNAKSTGSRGFTPLSV